MGRFSSRHTVSLTTGIHPGNLRYSKVIFVTHVGCVWHVPRGQSLNVTVDMKKGICEEDLLSALIMVAISQYMQITCTYVCNKYISFYISL